MDCGTVYSSPMKLWVSLIVFGVGALLMAGSSIGFQSLQSYDEDLQQMVKSLLAVVFGVGVLAGVVSLFHVVKRLW